MCRNFTGRLFGTFPDSLPARPSRGLPAIFRIAGPVALVALAAFAVVPVALAWQDESVDSPATALARPPVSTAPAQSVTVPATSPAPEPAPAGADSTNLLSAPSEESPTELPARTDTIPATEIAGRAEEVAARTSQLNASLSSEDEKDELALAESELEEIFTAIRELQEDPAYGELSHWTLPDIENLRVEWQRRKTQVDALRDRLESRGKNIEIQLTDIQEAEALWERTLASLRDEAIPAALLERASATRDELSATHEALEKRSRRILTMLDRVGTAAISVGDILSTVEAAYAGSGKRLLSADSPPLWHLLEADADEMAMRRQAGQAFRRNVSELLDYLSTQNGRLLLHLGLFAFLLFLMLSTRRHALGRSVPSGPGGAAGGATPSVPSTISGGAAAGADKDLARSLDARILSRPFSAALLISLIATLFIYPDAPIAHYRVALIAAVVPLLRLLHCVVRRRLIIPVYGLTGLYFLDLLSDLAVPRSTLQRLLLLASSLLGLAGLVVTMRPGGPITHSRDESRWWSVSLSLARLGGLALSIAVLANVLGRVALAEILTDGPIKSAYVALLFFAGYLVLSGLAALASITDVARKSRIVRLHSQLLLQYTRLVLRMAALLLWVLLALALFRLSGLVIGGMAAGFSYGMHIGDFAFTPGDILTFIATIVVSIWLARFIRFVLEEDVLTHVELPRGVSATISMLVRYSVIALGFLIAVRASGVELSQVTILAGALGVGIGFGLQNVVNNFISGLILAFERPIGIGDTIEFGGLIGKVREIGIRSSVIRTFQGAEVIVPNGNLIANEVTNWTLADRNRRLDIEVGVAYGSNPHRVIELLTGVGHAHPEILETPAPDTLFKGFGDSSLDFLLRCWTSNADAFLRIQSELVLAVHDALYKEGIQIPFPQRDLHLRSVDPGAGRSLGSASRRERNPEGAVVKAGTENPAETAGTAGGVDSLGGAGRQGSRSDRAAGSRPDGPADSKPDHSSGRERA